MTLDLPFRPRGRHRMALQGSTLWPSLAKAQLQAACSPWLTGGDTYYKGMRHGCGEGRAQEITVVNVEKSPFLSPNLIPLFLLTCINLE